MIGGEGDDEDAIAATERRLIAKDLVTGAARQRWRRRAIGDGEARAALLLLLLLVLLVLQQLLLVLALVAAAVRPQQRIAEKRKESAMEVEKERTRASELS